MNRLHLASALIACSAIGSLANAAEDVPKACCLPDGSCWNVTPDLCADWGGVEAPDGVFCSAWDCTPPEPVSCCEEGNLASIALKYTGASCDATAHEQAEGSVTCEGDPAGAELVYIIVADDDNLYVPWTHIWFEGLVELDEVFDVEAATDGRATLGDETHVFIFDLEAGLLQHVQFVTNCEQPLWHGDRFGAVELVDCAPCEENCEERQCKPKHERKCKGGKHGKRDKCQKRGKRGGKRDECDRGRGKRDKCDRGGGKRDQGRKGGGKRGGRGGRC